MLPLTSWLPAVLLAALPLTAAQTKTDCDPMKKDCPSDPALGISHHFHFNSTPPHDVWEKTASGDITYDPERGAVFKIAKKGESPTLRSRFYFFGGRSEMLMKCAPGRGIISSMMWLSDTRDEVDWEFFGTSEKSAATNYYGKGEEDSADGEYHDTGFNIYDDYHNYTTVWTKEKLEWWIDGKLVRTLVPADAQGGKFFPQTPMRLHLGIWAGGDTDSNNKGTVEWAGGQTNFDEGPFEMAVKSVKIEDFSGGSKEYIYGDRSGMWDSIEIVKGNSTVVEAIFREPELSLSEKWDRLPQGARIGIYAGAAALVAIIALGILFYFFRQRRRGAREANAAALRAEHERLELTGLGAKDDRWRPGDADYTVAEVRGDGTVAEKAFAGMGPRPDNSWPEDTHAAPLLGASTSPQGYEGYGYGPQSPAPVAPQGYGYEQQSPPPVAPQGYGYGQQSQPGQYGYGGPDHAAGYR